MLMDLETLRVGRRHPRRRSASRGRCCPRSAPRPRSTATARRAVAAARDARSPASSATSRRRRSARRRSTPARARTPTAPATSCSSTPATRSSTRKNGLLTTVGYKLGDAADALRARGLDRRHRVAHPVAARQPRHHRLGPRGRGAGRDGRRQRRRLLRAGVLGPVRAVLAAGRPRRDRRPHPLRQQGPHRPRGAGGRPPSRPARCSTR